MKRARAKKNSSRRRLRPNQAAGADFPFEKVVEVEAVRFHKDGTVDLFLEDADIPAAVTASENRRRVQKNTRTSKAKKRKTRKARR